MRIIHVIANMEIGGAQRLLADLLPIQAKTNDVTLLLLKKIDNQFTRVIINSGVKLLSINAKYYYNPFNGIALNKLTRGYDIIHVHLTPAVYGMAIASLFDKKRMILTEHSTSGRLRSKGYMRKIEQFVFGRYKKIISISEQTQEALVRWIGSDQISKHVVIPNGIDLMAYKCVRPSNSRDIIMVSRFAASKDQMTVIRAMSLLPEDVRLGFVGDGPTIDECKNLVRDLGLENRVVFWGFRSDIPAIISKYYIGVQSSHWEGFGLSVVELMASKRPVVVSDVEGLKQVVVGAGLLFESGNERDLANQILKLLEDNNYYEEIAEKCHDRALCYDIRNMAARYELVYNEIFNK